MGTMLLLWLPASPSLCRRRGGGLPLAGRPRVLDGEEGGGELLAGGYGVSIQGSRVERMTRRVARGA